MTMMKRLAALVLALAMLLTLAACGGDNTDGNDAQSGCSTALPTTTATDRSFPVWRSAGITTPTR